MTSFAEKARQWPHELVTRPQVPEFSGGLYKSSSMATFDSGGHGPKGRIKIGRIIAYPKFSLAEWLDARVTVIPDAPDPDLDPFS